MRHTQACVLGVHTHGESADPGGHDLGSDPSSVATELGPWATHTHAI